MSGVEDIVGLVLIIFAGLAIIVSGVILALTAWIVASEKLDRRRRRKRQGPLSDREVMDALAPFGADISVWPSRAPRNGSTSEVE